MLALAINTATFHESVALFMKGKLLAEKVWRGNSDESEKLLPAIFSLLKKTKRSFNDIEKIVVVKGPGPFSAVRIGTTVANTLAFTLGIPLFSIDSKTLWKLRAPTPDAVLLLHAGGNFVFRSGGGRRAHGASARPKRDWVSWAPIERGLAYKSKGVFSIEKVLKQAASAKIFFGNLTEKELETFVRLKEKSWKFIPEDCLETFGEVASGVESKMLKREKVATPLYWKPPNITSPKA